MLVVLSSKYAAVAWLGWLACHGTASQAAGLLGDVLGVVLPPSNTAPATTGELPRSSIMSVVPSPSPSASTPLPPFSSSAASLAVPSPMPPSSVVAPAVLAPSPSNHATPLLVTGHPASPTGSQVPNINTPLPALPVPSSPNNPSLAAAPPPAANGPAPAPTATPAGHSNNNHAAPPSPIQSTVDGTVVWITPIHTIINGRRPTNYAKVAGDSESGAGHAGITATSIMALLLAGLLLVLF